MNRKYLSVATSIALIAGLAAPTFAADLTPQTMHKVDVTTLGDGYRSSKMVGSAVTNSADESIGKVDALIRKWHSALSIDENIRGSVDIRSQVPRAARGKERLVWHGPATHVQHGTVRKIMLHRERTHGAYERQCRKTISLQKLNQAPHAIGLPKSAGTHASWVLPCS